MVFLIILGVLIGLAALLLWSRAGVKIVYGPQGLTVRLRLGVFRLRLWPARKKKEKQKKVKKERPPKEKKPSEPKPPTTWDEKKALLKLGLRAGGQFWRAVRVDRLTLRVTLAGWDAATLAARYGQAHAALGMLSPLLQNKVRRRDIRLWLDYRLPKTEASLVFAASVRVGRVLLISLSFLFSFLKLRRGEKSGDTTS